MENNNEKLGLKYYISFTYQKVIQKLNLDKELIKKIIDPNLSDDSELEVIQDGEPCEILNYPIEIDELIKTLTDLKNSGVNHVSVDVADDEDYLMGYRLQGVNIKPSTNTEIESYLTELNKK